MTQMSADGKSPISVIRGPLPGFHLGSPRKRSAPGAELTGDFTEM